MPPKRANQKPKTNGAVRAADLVHASNNVSLCAEPVLTAEETYDSAMQSIRRLGRCRDKPLQETLVGEPQWK